MSDSGSHSKHRTSQNKRLRTAGRGGGWLRATYALRRSPQRAPYRPGPQGSRRAVRHRFFRWCLRVRALAASICGEGGSWLRGPSPPKPPVLAERRENLEIVVHQEHQQPHRPRQHLIPEQDGYVCGTRPLLSSWTGAADRGPVHSNERLVAGDPGHLANLASMVSWQR